MLDLTVRRDGMLVELPACTGRSVQSSGGSRGGGVGGGRWWRWYMVSKDSNGIPWVMMIMIIIMIATKGAIRDLLAAPRTNNNNNNCYSRFFYNFLIAPRTVSNTYAQVARAQSCANHVQHIERLSRASVMLRATWYEGTAQLFCLTELK